MVKDYTENPNYEITKQIKSRLQYHNTSFTSVSQHIQIMTASEQNLYTKGDTLSSWLKLSTIGFKTCQQYRLTILESTF